MAARLALVIGAQCAALDPLPFLPPEAGDVALGALPAEQSLLMRLGGLLIDGPGECAPAEVDGQAAPGLLLNPTQAVADAALRAAIAQAHEQESVLIVHFLGHGTAYQDDPAHPPRHLLHTWDTVAEPVGTEPESKGWDPYGTVQARQPHATGMVGLVLMIDACRAGWSASQVSEWGGIRAGLTSACLAASADSDAWDACFTRTVVAALERGVPAANHPRKALVPDLLAADLRFVTAGRCPHQTPRLTGFDDDNPVLFVARNPAAGELAADLGIDAATEALLLRSGANYVPFAIEQVRAAIQEHRTVALVGGAGAGKTTLVAALLRPPSQEVKQGLVQAAAFAATTASLSELAATVRRQLERQPAFAAAATAFESRAADRLTTMDPWQRQVLGPLRDHLQPVRLVIDGLDQLEEGSEYRAIVRSLRALVDDPELGHVSLVVTSRHVPEELGFADAVDIPAVDEATARRYLAARGVPVADPGLAGGSWLLLRLLADVGSGPATLREAFDGLLAPVVSAHGDRAEALLAVLAVAGAGPRLPVPVLIAAMSTLGHQVNRAEVMRILGHERMRSVLDRARPGAADERLGLFHQTLADHVSGRSVARDAVLDYCRRWRDNRDPFAVQQLIPLLLEAGAQAEVDAALADPDYLALANHLLGPTVVLERLAAAGSEELLRTFQWLVPFLRRIADPAQVAVNLRARAPRLAQAPWQPPAAWLEPLVGWPLPDAPHPDLLWFLAEPDRGAMAWMGDDALVVGGQRTMHVYRGPGFLDVRQTPSPGWAAGMAWSPVGGLAIAVFDTAVYLMADGAAAARHLIDHPDGRLVRAIAWSADGRLAAGGSNGWLVVVTFHPAGKAGGRTHTVSTLDTRGLGLIRDAAWSADGRLAVADGSRGLVFDLDLRSAVELAADVGELTAVAWSPAGELTAGGTEGVAVRRGTRFERIDEQVSVGKLDWSPGGRLAGGDTSEDGRVYVWNGPGGKPAVLTGHDGPIDDLQWSPAGTLASLAAEGVRIWDAPNGSTGAAGSVPYVTCVAVHDGRVAWCGASGVRVREPDRPGWALPPAGYAHVAWTHDGDLVVAGSRGVEIWRRGARKPIWSLGGRVQPGPANIDVAADGAVAVAAERGLIWVWWPGTGEVVEFGADRSLWSWRVDGRGRMRATSVRLRLGDKWTSNFRELIGDFEARPTVKNGHLFALRWCPDGTLVTGYSDGSVHRWNVPELDARRFELSRPGRGVVRSLASSPDGQRIAAVRTDCVAIWDRSGKALSGIELASPGKAVAFSPAGLLAVGQVNGRIDVYQGVDRPVATFALAAEIGPDALRWSADGTHLYAGTSRGVAAFRLRRAG